MERSEIIHAIDELGMTISPVLRRDLEYDDHVDVIMNGRKTAFAYLWHLFDLKREVLSEYMHDFGEILSSINYIAKQKGTGIHWNEIAPLTKEILDKVDAEITVVTEIMGYTNVDIEALAEILT